MDLPRFHRELPGLYLDWGRPSVRPVGEQSKSVLRRVRGMTTAGVLELLNHAVGCLEGEECYLEVGSYHGATLIGALLGHPGRLAHAADNFTEFDPAGSNHATLLANLGAFGLAGQVRFHRQHFEPLLRGLRGSGVRVGVYLYDGAHDYRSQLLGLLLAVPLLAARALVVVDDGNFPAVKQATWDFMSVCPAARLLFDLPTPQNCHGSFWNGLQVLAWEAGADNGYDWPALAAARQTGLLASLDLLQEVQLSREGKRIAVSPVGR
jgi:hypothetical protein